ncbi:MAG: hypothetical protein ACM34K_17265 [Bacillota bacterium]
MTNQYVKVFSAIIICSAFLSACNRTDTKKETGGRLLPDNYFTINTKFITNHLEYIQADFEIKNEQKEFNGQRIPLAHFLFHYDKEGNYYDIRYRQFWKDTSCEIKVRRFPDNTYRAFYIRQKYNPFHLDDYFNPARTVASNLSVSEIKALEPDFNGKIVDGHVSNITINLDLMLSDSYGIPALFYKADNSRQDTLRFLLDCFRANGFRSEFEKSLIEYGSGAISYGQFLSQKEKWFFSEEEISHHKYLSRDGNIIDPSALKKDADKTAKDHLKEERTYSLNGSNSVEVTGFTL